MATAGFVLDASVAVAWAFADEGDAYAGRVLESLAEVEALVPALWPLEVGNALVGRRAAGAAAGGGNRPFPGSPGAIADIRKGPAAGPGMGGNCHPGSGAAAFHVRRHLSPPGHVPRPTPGHH